jgi:hypothetical protein
MVTVRPYHSADLARCSTCGSGPVASRRDPTASPVDQVVDLMASEQAMTVLAETGGRVVGMRTVTI